MADTKITALTAITTVDPAADVLPIVDVSDTSMAASGTTKKITSNQILGAGGTATLASATITGDLTVDTSTLKVDSANNRVGIGTASPSYDLEIAGAVRSSLAIRGNFAGGTDIAHLRFINANGSVVGDIYAQNTNGGASDSAYLSFNTVSSGTSAERYRIASDGVATWSNVGGVAGTAMTLNATGLTMSTGSLNSQYWYGINATSMISSGSGSWPLLFGINGSEKARIDSAGNLGIGVQPSAWASNRRALQVGGLAAAALALNGTSNVSEMFFNSFINTSASNVYAVNGRAGLIDFGSGGFGFSIDSGTQTAGAACNFTRAMTLDASGNLLVGTTSSIGKVSISYAYPSTGIGLTTDSNSTQTAIQFNTPAGLAGYINTSTTTTTYNSVSDYRLKESVQPMVGGLARVSAMKPSIYKWKADGSNGEGFIAHELAEVVPAAVSGEKDAVNEDGSIKAQGVDLSKVVPVLVAAIQELTARVQTLETR